MEKLAHVSKKAKINYILTSNMLNVQWVPVCMKVPKVKMAKEETY